MTSGKNGDRVNLNSILAHIFFHRALELPVNGNPEKIVEEQLFNPFVKEIFKEKFFQNDAGKSICPNTFKTLKLWTQIQPDGILDPAELSAAMKNLQPGDSLALYICEQNAGIIFQVPRLSDTAHRSADTIILSTFAPSQSSATVMSAPGDLVASFPGNSVHLSRTNLLKSRVFANQLELFHLNQMDETMSHSRKAGRSAPELREVADPMFITQWLPAFLSDDSSSICTHGSFVIKKIRDDVTYERGSHLPFRRSGFWMTLKVVLQLSLVQELGDKAGLFVYKMMLLHFMCRLAQKWMKQMDTDTGIQVMRKLTRRILKLDEGLRSGKLSQDPVYSNICRLLCTQCQGTLESLYKHFDDNWKEFICTEFEKRATKYTFQEDIRGLAHHKLNSLKQYLESSNLTSLQSQSYRKLPLKAYSVSGERSTSTADFELFQISTLIWETRDEESTGITLLDFEKNIGQLESLPLIGLQYHLQRTSLPQLVGLFKHYLAKGKSYYESDPVGGSKMILTLFKIIKIMDFWVCNSAPFKLLQDHRPGVRTEIISELLLTNRNDLKAAARVEHYFQERDRCANFNSFIGEESVSKNSFSVRYARDNQEIQLLKLKIHNISEQCIRDKNLEVMRAQEKCRNLRAQAKTQEHRYSTGLKRRHVKRNKCPMCILESAIKSMSVSVYEKPLPTEEFQQDAVLFELMAPIEISCLRDVLFLFEKELNASILRSMNIQPWNAQPQLQSHFKSDLLYKDSIVFLGSSVKSVGGTHYKGLHPEQHPCSSFISENGYNCVYGAEGCMFYTLSLPTSIKKFTTLSVDLGPGSHYAFLQKYLAKSTHNENDILANQNECPQKLSLSEYKAFGTLRSGHRLQWHNIYRALATGTLSFKEESVFKLICQATWEGGPRDSENRFWRESHESLRDSIFIKKFLKTLEDKLKENSKNWDGFCILATIIVLLTKIFTVNEDPDIQKTVSGLILASRKIALGWCENIEDQLTKMSSATVAQTEINAMREKLIQVGFCAGLTFDVVVPRRAEDYADWLRGIVKIQDNISLSDSSAASLPISTRNGLRQVRRIVIELEAQLDAIIRKNGLKEFLKSYWSPAKDNRILASLESGSMSRSGTRTRVYSAIASNYELTMDIICGTFTVNGSPVGRLSDAIRKAPTFQRIFEGIIFEITPTIGIYANTTETLYSYNGRKYKFAQLGVMDGTRHSFDKVAPQNHVIITETNDDQNRQYQLIPHEVFSGELPYRLVHNYSHWYSRNLNLIQFRPVRFQDSRFLDPPEFTLNLHSGELMEESGNGRRIVNINTPRFEELAKIFQKLEHPNHLLVFSDGNQLTVDLPRCALHFSVTESQILSKEYDGMRVAENETLGTLIGLRSGLLLVSTESDFETSIVPPILLVPHGEVNVISRPGFPASMSISTENLSIPEYFAYEVDSHLGRLKAGQSHCGWLYLAYLHAVTSHPLPDPFTSMTGTESALQLLQSACCWSGEPLGPEKVKILNNIAELSPKRVYYPPHLKTMQQVVYATGLTAMIAHDGFRFIVEKLMSDSERMAFLFKTESEIQESLGAENELWKSCNRELCERAYHRYSKTCNEQALFQPQFLTLRQPELKSVSCYEILRNKILDSGVLKNTRILAHLTQHTATGTVSHSEVLTNEFGKLNQLSVVTDDDGGNSMSIGLFLPEAGAVAKDFQNYWFWLYETAKRVKSQKVDCDWYVLLSYLAYENVALDHLLILHTVSQNPEKFKAVDPPPYSSYTNTSEASFDSKRITDILVTAATSYFPKHYDQQYHHKEPLETDVEFHLKLANTFKSQVESKVANLVQQIQSKWPRCYEIQVKDSSNYPEFNFLAILPIINSCLTQWKQNMALHEFFKRVTRILTTLDPRTPLPTIANSLSPPITQFPIPRRGHELPNLVDMFQAEIVEEELRMLSLIEQMHTCRLSQEIKNPILAVSKADPKMEMFPLREVVPYLSCAIGRFYLEELQRSWDLHQESKKYEKVSKYGNHSQLKQFYNQNMQLLWKEIEHELSLFHPKDSLINYSVTAASGLYPRISALNLLALAKVENIQTKKLYRLTIAYGVLLTQLQRENRILRYGHAGKSMERSLARELENPGHSNWDPKERPAWLLFEIEMDLMIRPDQIKVAEKMERPDGGKSSLMQLNMGEGKTTVILPLLISSLANRTQLCRVTVLRSLFQMNKDSLRASVGGILLNKRLYVFPCRRDMNIKGDGISIMKRGYQECIQKAGFVLTVPEYRLSFQLKGTEKCRGGELADSAVPLLELQGWLLTNARDVLDECDELLREKYQLVYTVGSQRTLDGGGAARWGVTQKLLKLVPGALTKLIQKYGREVGECSMEPTKSESFPHCRIFKSDHYKELCELLVAEILHGTEQQKGRIQLELPTTGPEEDKIITDFLTIPTVDEVTHNAAMTLYREHYNHTTLLVLRGLLATGILYMALDKRWRVNYGINPKPATGPECKRLSAVPFRAKDVAAERTEFGHPDVAIIFTQLNYYYQGLTDTQIVESFKCLYDRSNADREYDRWLSLVASPDSSISSLRGLNLKDFEQRTKLLFPVLRKNVAVIDFWLNHSVFPREAKAFEWKMLCSPWDLSYSLLPVTGFSGTNDTKLHLPLHISQQDLPELLGTNGKVLDNLMVPENNNYETLTKTRALDIVEKLVGTQKCKENQITVLLDVGALMLELSNEMVADTWLRLSDLQIEAAVYFDQNDVLMVMNRKGRQCPLEVSPYATRLNHCVVYLDDGHTRGTDLKLPRGTSAAVTLGKGLGKDKFVQCCMRMRMLGNGHRVYFWSSPEVHNEILDLISDGKTEPGTEDVIGWTLHNSITATRDGFMHWVNAGVSFSCKMAGFAVFHGSGKTETDYQSLRELILKSSQSLNGW